MLAKLVAVCREDDFDYQRRQLPLCIDETLTLIMQFSESCIACDHSRFKQKELESFARKYNSLTKEEVEAALLVSNEEILSMLAQLVTCVGCRCSVERLYYQLVQWQYPALEPLVVTPNAELTLVPNYIQSSDAVYSLFHLHRCKLGAIINAIPKSKKNKRCSLHCLDIHRSRSSGNWMDVWEMMSQSCRDEVVLIDAENLLDTVDTYLNKHRFCSECKSKVMRAYSLLIGELDCAKEKGYLPSLYEGIRCCSQDRHIHVLCDTDFLAQLISRAEPELVGSHRERHAKTIDIAQEEVLTCLGIHLYERLHLIWQKIRAEEQTWEILFYLGIATLKKSFELALEKKQGFSNLQLACEQITEAERAKERRREQKREKRKRNKSKLHNKENLNKKEIETTCKEYLSSLCEDSHILNDLNDPYHWQQESCNSKSKSNTVQEKTNLSSPFCPNKKKNPQIKPSKNGSPQSDQGYSSGFDGSEGSPSWSPTSSCESSEVACTEGLCNHDGDPSPEFSEASLILNVEEKSTSLSQSKSWKCSENKIGSLCSNSNQQYGMRFSLEDMLEDSCSSDEDDDENVISQEEIQRFRANQPLVHSKRQELRKLLRQRFDLMLCTHCCVRLKNQNSSTYSVS